ncbi:hypothetical protein A0257_13510 [Hymenobacter psoromatis]|nr:hypothetical protein A0257_13510 [Hymenobacter psoromatis]
MPNIREIKSSFRHSVKLGTGQAYLLARDNPEVDFSTYIIEAALKNFAYDGQAESSRAAYLFALYNLLKQPARIRRAVIRGLATEREDTWTLTQLFGLALLFAQHGDAQARKALYRQFLNKPAASADWLGAEEIITLDGLAGLRYIAQKFGRALAKNPDDWQDDQLIQTFQEQYPALDAWAQLRQLAQQDDEVRRYLQNVEATLASQAAHPRPARQEIDLKQMIRVPQQRAFPFLWRRCNLQPDELNWLAERVLIERNNVVLENMLFIFGHHKFPLAYQPILALAQQKTSGSHRIQEYAIDALHHLQAREIREFALQKLATTTRPSQFTALLISNYQEGDAVLLTSLANRFHNEHSIEQLACSYVEIYAANKTAECALPLLALYQNRTYALGGNLRKSLAQW